MYAMARVWLTVSALAVACLAVVGAKDHHQYCVIGAGPGGLQMAYFLHHAGRDYILFEKGHCAGTFYTKFPIHRTLISINKRHTGKTNKEFNLRHDWNSIISHDESLRVGLYSKEFFPPADVYVRYLNDFARELNLNVQFNTTIGNIGKRDPDDQLFHISDQHGKEYTCTTIIAANGISKPSVPTATEGTKHFLNYHDLTLDTEPFEGKSVLILGRGNSGFETAQHIMGSANSIHMLARTRVRLAWSTHYVGDLRAINNGLLDTYQLKSLDGIIEGDANDLGLIRSEIDGRLYLNKTKKYIEKGYNVDNDALREGHDIVISCLGFQFDDSLFNSSVKVNRAGTRRLKKYPRITYQYESADIPGVFFAGTNTHSLDFRRSAGGFIHGFRYTTRTLHRILETRYHNVTWPSVNFKSTIDLIPHMFKRLNEASDIYQMFSTLCEIIIFSEDDTEVTYLEAYPCALISRLPKVSGHPAPGKVIVVAMEYGKNASGPGKDVFNDERAIGDASEAHHCNFLHPILYYYKTLPSDKDVLGRPKKWILPIPDRLHHIVEDFTTVFDAPKSHFLVVRRFFENILGRDLRQFFVQQCMAAALTSATLPESCRIYDMNGRGVSPGGVVKDNHKILLPWLVQRLGIHTS